MMSPILRKLGLTTHITVSVGWLRAIAGFLVFAIVGLASQDPMTVRSSYISMELISWFIIVPFSFSALVTGTIQSLGTTWGLFKNYWILVKLVLTLVAIVILLIHMEPISYTADMASSKILSDSDLQGLRVQLVADAGAALIILIIITAISVYKPWGRTNFGVNKSIEPNKMQYERKSKIKAIQTIYVLIGLFILVILAFIFLHLTGVMKGH